MKKRTFFTMTAILIIVEQVIKLIINAKYFKSNIAIIEDFLYFKPLFNRDYSWINSLFNLGVSKMLHIIMVTFIVVMVFLVYLYIDHNKHNTKVVSTAFSFLLAGGTCSWIDKVFWDGSLDYIYLVGHFTFDLKDVFINIFIGLMILMFITDHQGIRSSESDHLFKNFRDFLLRRNK